MKILVSRIDAAAVRSLGPWLIEPPRLGKTAYASINANGRRLRLHKFIAMRMGISGEQIDHKNRNGLDCRRSNIRAATARQNQANIAPRKDNTSGYKGVCRSSCGRYWRAQIRRPGGKSHLGFFKTKEEAAIAYNKAAKKTFGKFAYLNKL